MAKIKAPYVPKRRFLETLNGYIEAAKVKLLPEFAEKPLKEIKHAPDEVKQALLRVIDVESKSQPPHKQPWAKTQVVKDKMRQMGFKDSDVDRAITDLGYDGSQQIYTPTTEHLALNPEAEKKVEMRPVWPPPTATTVQERLAKPPETKVIKMKEVDLVSGKVVAEKRYEFPEKPSAPPTGQCYVDAYRFMLKEGGKLVHGKVTSPADGRVINHAWIELETGWIYEPQTENMMRKEQFEETFKPQVEVAYTPTEAAKLALKSRHYGPWKQPETTEFQYSSSFNVAEADKLNQARTDLKSKGYETMIRFDGRTLSLYYRKGEQKEPWQMTKEEWKRQEGYEPYTMFQDYSPSQWAAMSKRTQAGIERANRAWVERNEAVLDTHRNAVVEAHFKGLAIPSEVLREYQDAISQIRDEQQRITENRETEVTLYKQAMSLDKKDFAKLWVKQELERSPQLQSFEHVLRHQAYNYWKAAHNQPKGVPKYVQERVKQAAQEVEPTKTIGRTAEEILKQETAPIPIYRIDVFVRRGDVGPIISYYRVGETWRSGSLDGTVRSHEYVLASLEQAKDRGYYVLQESTTSRLSLTPQILSVMTEPIEAQEVVEELDQRLTRLTDLKRVAEIHGLREQIDKLGKEWLDTFTKIGDFKKKATVGFDLCETTDGKMIKGEYDSERGSKAHCDGIGKFVGHYRTMPGLPQITDDERLAIKKEARFQCVGGRAFVQGSTKNIIKCWADGITDSVYERLW